MKLAITGANSSVGKSLLELISKDPSISVAAGVRSESAFAALPDTTNITPLTINYSDPASLQKAFNEADCVIHLAGILIETSHSNYQEANVEATRAVAEAARACGVKRLVFISVVGADAKSGNAYFRSKGEAESIIIESGIPGTVLRTPILIGRGTAGSSALVAAAQQDRPKILGAGNYTMHPLDVDDLCQAILNSSSLDSEAHGIVELVGPEALTYNQLIQRMAQALGRSSNPTGISVGTAKLLARVVGLFKKGGMTPTVIDVITLNETVSSNSPEKLGIELTPLQKTLEKLAD